MRRIFALCLAAYWAYVRRPQAPEIALAAVFCAAALVEAVLADVDERGITLAAALATTVPLAWRVVAPFPVALFTTLVLPAAVAAGLPTGDVLVSLVAPGVAAYSVAAHGSLREMAIVGLGATAAIIAATAASGAERVRCRRLRRRGAHRAAGRPRGARDGLRGRRARGAHDALERERDARRGVADERARIARELHDVIGHSIR